MVSWEFQHRDGAGHWHNFDASSALMIAHARALGLPSVRLPTMTTNPPQKGKDERTSEFGFWPFW